MADLVRYEEHVTAQLQQGADEQNQIPPVDSEEIQEHEELALEQNLADRGLDKLAHADGAAAALTLESSSSNSSISRSAPAASPTAPNSFAAAIRTPTSLVRDRRSAAGPKLGSANDSATRRPASAARPEFLSRNVASGPATTPPMRRSAF